MSAYQRSRVREARTPDATMDLSLFARNQSMFPIMVRSAICLGPGVHTVSVAIAVLP